ncbi:cation diffusion facilitator CzcD-associated flavoprotein CzcO [Tibeticola sediminis]|uniref:Cation diffusion facilitator CzcD-associated flavoprotein CzcO n=1 Tax=Tibeticola sediminis TaxID=1917811 RepID=A0A3N4UK54_9BURK|nr:alpha/beta hydrolase fold domain-containing protein [Tibeticola sediminis]RPE70823.1 cation diffusion facilitator CzcD-associated flavoprotein CzcO [Tibeticola sediminis]
MLAEYTPDGWRERVVAFILRWTLRLLLKPVFSPRFSVAFQRRWLEALSRIAIQQRGVRREAGEVAGVRGEWFRRDGPALRAGTLLYLHGGAYCVGSTATHRALTARIAWATGLPVFSADYRLAPEHPFPAGLEDALAAYRALRAQGPVVVAGDSAGGGLTLALALALRDAGDPPPAGLWLLSPWADLVVPDPPPPEPPGEAMLSVAWAQVCARLYLFGASALSGERPQPELEAEFAVRVLDPLVSPMRGDLGRLPPVLIQCGTDELLHPMALALHDALLQAGNPSVRCEVTRHRWHVFQMHVHALPSADQAVDRAARFLLEQIDAQHPPGGSAEEPEDREVVILGAGMSGLCMAAGLLREGRRDFVILEKQPGLGGTWWDNRYPGAHVDVPAPVYSFSFAPNPRWSRRFASAPEIQRYMQALAERLGLLPHLRLRTRLVRAQFDADSGRWILETEAGQTLRARFFVCSTGPLNQPRWPEIEGLERYAGERLHSARWDDSVAVAGRRVGVIGTGSTASQLIPPMAAQAARLHVFQRTANWVLPRLDRRYGALDRVLAQFPPYARAVRTFWIAVLEWGRKGFDEGTLARRGMLRAARALRERQIADPTLRERLTPPYPLGCKRIIYSNEYYPALAQPHVELVTEPIVRITERGIVTADGQERALDVLICATGFDTVHLLSSVEVRGREGLRLSDAWAKGPEAYLGVSVAGFPNFFLLLGPNTATGHTSTLLYIEPEVEHVLACMSAVRAGEHRAIEVRAEAQRRWNERLQSRLAGSVWSLCRSWYRMENGRIVALFPGFTAEYVRAVRRPNWADYTLA